MLRLVVKRRVNVGSGLGIRCSDWVVLVHCWASRLAVLTILQLTSQCMYNLYSWWRFRCNSIQTTLRLSCNFFLHTLALCKLLYSLTRCLVFSILVSSGIYRINDTFYLQPRPFPCHVYALLSSPQPIQSGFLSAPIPRRSARTVYCSSYDQTSSARLFLLSIR